MKITHGGIEGERWGRMKGRARMVGGEAIGRVYPTEVVDALREAGAGEGATVRIGDMEFDFVE